MVTVYTGPIGVFLYVLGCREPLPGLHERYVAVRWRQVLGSTMHCVAGDGIGILAGAAIASFLTLPRLVDIGIEYVLGFGFGWTIFQALFMRSMAGGEYRRSLMMTFIPEFLSMNLLMAGMVPIAALGRAMIGEPLSPFSPDFWFVMSMALLVGSMTTYPMNWWLVAKDLKHGMMTVRPAASAVATAVPAEHRVAQAAAQQSASQSSSSGHHRDGHGSSVSSHQIIGMCVVSIALLMLGIGIATLLGTRS